MHTCKADAYKPAERGNLGVCTGGLRGSGFGSVLTLAYENSEPEAYELS